MKELKMYSADFAALDALEHRLSVLSLPQIIQQLIKVRCSQINHCKYCTELHIVEAMNVSETRERLLALHHWPDSALFNEEEKLALAVAEELTLLPLMHAHGTAIEKAIEAKGNKFASEVVFTTLVINAWNRMMRAQGREYVNPSVA